MIEPHNTTTKYQHEPGYQANVSHHPYRKASPKRQPRVRLAGRVKKGPMESRG